MLFSGITFANLIASVIALVIAISVHEAAHAWAAWKLGDPTARMQGRLTLNPLKHLDPLGALMLLTAGFGWGKPVPVNPYNLRNGPKAGMMVTSLAGPASNLLTAALFALPLRFDIIPASWQFESPLRPDLVQVLVAIVLINIGLAVFNLLPVAPLDGFKVAIGLLPHRWAMAWARTEQYGPFILLGLLLIGRVLPGLDPLGAVMWPVQRFFLRLFVGV